MKAIDRFSIDHTKVDGARLHNDLNKLADTVNTNFAQHTELLVSAAATIKAQKAQIDDLMTRVTVLESNAS